MTALPPHPGLSGLAAREAAADLRAAVILGPGPHDRITVGAVTAERLTTPAEVTRAADDDADHKGLTHAEWVAVNARLRTRSALDRVAALNRTHGLYDDPAPCGCCGPQLCCCDCHKEER